MNMDKKFDVVIGNPPYQEERKGERAAASPIYDQFMDAAYELADQAILITPARFLFNAGATKKSWNEKMLSDKHLKVSWYDADSGKIFPGTNIPGGIAVTYRNSKKLLEPIGVFSRYDELNSIRIKVTEHATFESFEPNVSNRGSYRYSDNAYADVPALSEKTSDRRVAPSAFDRLPEMFFNVRPTDDHAYVRLMGREDGTMIYKWVRSDYLTAPESLWDYKVVVSKGHGAAGIIGKPVPAQLLGKPFVEEPGVGFTETFISAGSFKTSDQAHSCVKYLSGKFARVMLGVLKATQNIPASVWKYIPNQNFTDKSDIDWSKSTPEIDQQLYKKYRLSAAEIDFVESYVRAMD